MLTPGDHVALVANSDGLAGSWLDEVDSLRTALESLGLRHSTALPIDRSYGEQLTPPTAHPADDRQRAEHLTDVLEDPAIAAVMDVSGGQLASGVLTYLDPARLANTTGFFMGFSNLTTIANAIHAAGGPPSLLCSPRVLALNEAVLRDFTAACVTDGAEQGRPEAARPGSAFITPEVEFVRGSTMSGTVVGGNLTALLSLAGTPWFPSTAGTIIAIEALSPTYSAVAVGLHQMRQIGVFERAAGVLLGQFTAVDETHGPMAVPGLALEIIPDIPLATTRHFGHSSDSRALMIGEEYRLSSS